MDKALYVADWTAKHSPDSAAAAARRRLPSAPSKDEVTDESLREVERILARSELSTTTSNIRPSFKPSIKPLIDTGGSTSYRSLPYSTNYNNTTSSSTSRQGGESAASRASIRRKPLTSNSSYMMSSRTGSAGARSNSCLTSQHSDYQAWRSRKTETKKPSSSVTSSCNSSSSSSSSNTASKQKLRMTQSMVNGNMKRSNSFHHDNLQNSQQSTKEGSAEPRTYRTSDDYYLDEDELFLPLYSTEPDEPYQHEVRSGHRDSRGDQVSALDTLGEIIVYKNKNCRGREWHFIKHLLSLFFDCCLNVDVSVINTTHNVSQKLCHAASDLLRGLSSSVSGLEQDADTSLTLETVTYLLEDTNMIQGNRNKMSSELAGIYYI